jgi:hypothetical protein
VQVPAAARPIVDALRSAGGPSVRAVLLFGSQLVRAAPDRHSAWDVVAVVDAYAPFHRHLVAGGHHRRPAWLLTLLARVLPPNITAFDPGGGAPFAKVAIVSARDFERALGPRPRDHFLKGRMVQKVALAWASDDQARRDVEGALRSARRDVLSWVGPYLEGTFDTSALARRMLEVSYAGELRPESGDRVQQVYDVQRDFLEATYARVLREAAERGAVEAVADGRFRTAPASTRRRLGLRLYFTRSKLRATARWLKHVITFNDWLTYVQRKVERRTGMRVEITPWERRLPLLLLWPKVVRVLRGRRGAAPPPDLPPTGNDS